MPQGTSKPPASVSAADSAGNAVADAEDGGVEPGPAVDPAEDVGLPPTSGAGSGAAQAEIPATVSTVTTARPQRGGLKDKTG
ncbi:hypothetical protein [Arthrobacter sp. CAN_C5]|uniref:hypothetical protein n=1 Tax=Arthrobacter sp. CAN_C5 TaxID=2760706 RepID=UPI001FD8A966|nr:hypothetical protein [Arthrobacter sp. CAN_C5]MBP2216225.1 hypothetical protein [Arthrobacter sp. CAN_C5]